MSADVAFLLYQKNCHKHILFIEIRVKRKPKLIRRRNRLETRNPQYHYPFEMRPWKFQKATGHTGVSIPCSIEQAVANCRTDLRKPRSLSLYLRLFRIYYQ